MTATARRTAGADEQAVSPLSGYRPYLDGLRAVAVYLVVLFHAGVDRLSGGFIGVDVFFVLSGFLVTQLLMRDLVGLGSIRLGRFYSRRFRRLLPAAFVTLIITALVFTAVAPIEALAAIDAFKAAFLYSTNWYFIDRSTGYFGAEVANNPVLHFWSLAVEEQFYLLWPLVLGGIFWLGGRFSRHQVRMVRLLVAAGALMSVTWALSLRETNPNRAYFGTDARAYQLLAGALIALTPSLVPSLGRLGRWIRIVTAIGMGALLLLASSWVHLDAIQRGVAVTLVAVLLIVALECRETSLVKRALVSDPLVYLGKISYATYLWHWPVIIIATKLVDPSPIALAGIACLVATGLASLSFQLLERPVRESRFLDGRRRAVIASGLAISVVSALVLIPMIVDPGSATEETPRASTTKSFTPIPAAVDTVRTYREGFGKDWNCARTRPERCTVVRGTGRHLLLMGDSNAVMWVSAFTKLARQENLTLSLEVTAGCPWQRDLYRLSAELRARCRQNKEDAYRRVIPALSPDLIVLANAPWESVRSSENTPDGDLLRKTSVRSLDELGARRTDLVVIEPIPAAPRDYEPLGCLSKAKVLEECRYIVDGPPTWLEVFQRGLADKDDHVWSADFDRLVCPFLPICDPVIDDLIVKWNATHLSQRYAGSLADDIAAYLRANDLIPRRR